MRLMLPQSLQNQEDVRIKAAIQGFSCKLEVQDLPNFEPLAEVTPQGNRVVAEVEHRLWGKEMRRVKLKVSLRKDKKVGPNTPNHLC